MHAWVVMPDHVHGIIELINGESPTNVGAEKLPPTAIPVPVSADFPERAKGFSPRQSPSKTIGSIIRGFKIGVTKWMRQHTDVQDVWQRNYYEHIIRNHESLNRIRAYIANNPAKWKMDHKKPTH